MNSNELSTIELSTQWSILSEGWGSVCKKWRFVPKSPGARSPYFQPPTDYAEFHK